MMLQGLWSGQLWGGAWEQGFCNLAVWAQTLALPLTDCVTNKHLDLRSL